MSIALDRRERTAAETAHTCRRDDKLLEIATCEGCNFNPAQYWAWSTNGAAAFLCEGCVAERGGIAK